LSAAASRGWLQLWRSAPGPLAGGAGAELRPLLPARPQVGPPPQPVRNRIDKILFNFDDSAF